MTKRKRGDARLGFNWIGKLGHKLADFSFQDNRCSMWLIEKMWDVGYHHK